MMNISSVFPVLPDIPKFGYQLGSMRLTGPTTSSGTGLNNIPVNTVVNNTIDSAFYDSSKGVVILPPGTYEVTADVQAQKANQYQLRLINYKGVSGGVEVVRGCNTVSSSTTTNSLTSRLKGVFSFPNGAELNLVGYFSGAGTSNILNQTMTIRKLS